MSEQEQQSMTISDEKIVDMYWERNQRAIQETDWKYGSMLRNVSYNILCDLQDCEECQNDTYLKIWNAIPSARPPAFPAFISRIMRCTAISRYKQKSRKKRFQSQLTISLDELEELSSGLTVEEMYDAKEIGRLITEYVKQLDEQQRYIFIDRYYLLEPVDKTAHELGISNRKAYYEIEKIKKSLREYLERNGVLV